MKQIEIKGIKLFIREEQPHYDDKHVVNEVIVENCYRLTPKDVKDKVIVDIGANIGDFSLMVWKWGAKRIIAYEPEPHNLELLKMNVALNNANIEIKPVAVGKKGYSLMDDGSGHSQIGRKFGNKVRVESINDLKIDHIDLLKMDCEGGEYDMIEDAKEETLKKIDKIIGEFHSWRWEKEPERHQKLIEKLEKFFKLSYWGFKNSTFRGIKK